MPLIATPSQLPSGARCVRLEGRGDITKEDAEAVSKELGAGGPLSGVPILALTRDVRSVSPEARHVFGGRGDLSAPATWTAVVVTSPVVRVTTNFVMRINKAKRQRLFSTEAEAVQWLEERIKEDQARAKVE
jgi:hypothetical protein